MDVAALSKVQPPWTTDLAPKRNEEPAVSHKLIAAVEAANQIKLLGEGSQLAFRFDRETGQRVIEARDKVTGEVILQIPPESLLHVMQSLTSTPPQETIE